MVSGRYLLVGHAGVAPPSPHAPDDDGDVRKPIRPLVLGEALPETNPAGKKIVPSPVESCCTAACTVLVEIFEQHAGSAQAPSKPHSLNPKPYSLSPEP